MQLSPRQFHQSMPTPTTPTTPLANHHFPTHHHNQLLQSPSPYMFQHHQTHMPIIRQEALVNNQHDAAYLQSTTPVPQLQNQQQPLFAFMSQESLFPRPAPVQSNGFFIPQPHQQPLLYQSNGIASQQHNGSQNYPSHRHHHHSSFPSPSTPIPLVAPLSPSMVQQTAPLFPPVYPYTTASQLQFASPQQQMRHTSLPLESTEKQHQEQ